MKNIKKNILLVGAAILAMGSASVASAQTLYNVQFGDTNDTTATYTGNGAVANPTDSAWNPVFGPEAGSALSSGDLLSSTGGSSSITVTTSVVNTGNHSVSGPSGNSLLDSFIFPGGSTFSINNLTAGLTYNLYVYANVGDVAAVAPGTGISVNGSAVQYVSGVGGSFSATPATSDFVNGVEYTEFTIVDLVGTTITGAFNDPTNGGGAINGFQLQAESLSVPEPSVTILLGLGLMSLIVLRRARRIS